jgi:acetylglutamate kinase
MITVVKVGGAAHGAVREIAPMAARGRRVVVVHGAGPQISARCRAAGVEPAFIGGQRVTDAVVLEVVETALRAENRRLVDELSAAGVPAVGAEGVLSGARSGDARLGLVGTVTGVDVPRLLGMLGDRTVPVLTPMAGGLNVNADHAAAAIASALSAVELVFLSDVPGVLDAAGSVIRRIRAAQALALIESGQVSGGMVPKLQAGLAAVAAGVWRVWIGAETMVTA